MLSIREKNLTVGRYRWMSKEPAEIFERAAEEGFIQQVGQIIPRTRKPPNRVFVIKLKHHSTVSQFGQLNGALALDGVATRAHFREILYNQVCYYAVQQQVHRYPTNA